MRSLLLSFLSFLLLAAAPAAADVLDEPLPPTPVSYTHLTPADD